MLRRRRGRNGWQIHFAITVELGMRRMLPSVASVLIVFTKCTLFASSLSLFPLLLLSFGVPGHIIYVPRNGLREWCLDALFTQFWRSIWTDTIVHPRDGEPFIELFWQREIRSGHHYGGSAVGLFMEPKRCELGFQSLQQQLIGPMATRNIR